MSSPIDPQSELATVTTQQSAAMMAMPVQYANPAPVQYTNPAPVQSFTPTVPVRPFVFDGGAGSYLGISIGAFLITVLSLGLLLPIAICMKYRWRSNHTIINGYRVRFTGSAGGLFGNWIKWWFLIIVTLGGYSFWVGPRLTRWIVEHQEFTGLARL